MARRPTPLTKPTRRQWLSLQTQILKACDCFPAFAPATEPMMVAGRNLEYLVARGDLLRALPSHADTMGSNKAVVEHSRKAIMVYWLQQLITAYDLPPGLARMGVVMTTAAPGGAPGALRRGNVLLDDAADFWTTFVRAGWRAVAKAV